MDRHIFHLCGRRATQFALTVAKMMAWGAAFLQGSRAQPGTEVEHRQHSTGRYRAHSRAAGRTAISIAQAGRRAIQAKAGQVSLSSIYGRRR